MFIKKNLFISFIVLCFAGFYSCSSDDDKDTTGPTITLDAPANGQFYHRGQDIHIDFELEDESGIENYKIDIHWGEGHSHGSAVATVAHNHATPDGDAVPWSFQKVYTDKRGQTKAHVHVHSDKIPDNAKYGEYHFGVLATDAVGNESQKYISIYIIDKDDVL